MLLILFHWYYFFIVQKLSPFSKSYSTLADVKSCLEPFIFLPCRPMLFFPLWVHQKTLSGEFCFNPSNSNGNVGVTYAKN